MKVGITIDGLDEVIKAFEDKASIAIKIADKEIGQATKEMSEESSARAPVLTGDLRDSLKESYEKFSEANYGYGTKLPYGRMQEYHNPNGKQRFIRNVVTVDKGNKISKELGEALKKGASKF